MSTDTALPDEAQLVALGRSAAYACLARGFAWPDAEAQILAPADTDDRGPLSRLMRRLCEAGEAGDVERLRRSYMRIFDPRRAPHPFEAEHCTEHFRQRTDLLADLMGFYQAFAVCPDHERPDHIACELEFVHLLSLKEARALRSGGDEQAAICASAREAFLAEHLLQWYEPIVEMIRQRATEPEDLFYRVLADLLEALMAREKETQP